jgi:hypothetical protein
MTRSLPGPNFGSCANATSLVESCLDGLVDSVGHNRNSNFEMQISDIAPKGAASWLSILTSNHLSLTTIVSGP